MIEKLACSIGRNDELPNIELAESLCQSKDIDGIAEIVEGFKGIDKAIANDCIKVLYEIGERNPELICGYASDFVSALYSKNNRIVWGSMTALAKIAELAPIPIFEKIEVVIYAYKNGSTITVDNSISVFAGLCKTSDECAKELIPVLAQHLKKCRPKEVAQHAERASICFNKSNADMFIDILEQRFPHLAASQQARVNKLLRVLNGVKK